MKKFLILLFETPEVTHYDALTCLKQHNILIFHFLHECYPTLCRQQLHRKHINNVENHPTGLNNCLQM